MDDDLIKNLITANKLLDERRLRELDALAASSDQSIFDLVVTNNYIREDTILELLAGKFGLEYVRLDDQQEADRELLALLPEHVRLSRGLLPLERNGQSLRVAVADPMRVELLDALAAATGLTIEPVLATAGSIGKLVSGEALPEDGGGGTELELDDKSLEDLANEAPTIKLVNLIIMRAISEEASDIHIEPYEDEAVVRYRIDGVLREVSRHRASESPAIISRIKIMANLNIAERRVPQDGRISLRLMDRNFDLRVATIPVLHNEGVVMRILDKDNKILHLKEMGFSPDNLSKCLKHINRPHGIILLTGPTGSGKTTTLNAAISEINSPERKIITIEDPVEYEIKGVSQIHVNAKVGLTFASGLRSILRLDPDVVMVGEIRDTETAEIAIRTALTGHLVFSTLHTNSGASAVTRLLDMEIEPYLIASCLNAVIAQRLVRRICSFCSEQSPPTDAARALLAEIGRDDVDRVITARGCDECSGSGYRGRLAIHEFFEIDDRIRELILQKTTADVLQNEARKVGMKTLREDGIEKFLAGLTTAEEIIRVTQMD